MSEVLLLAVWVGHIVAFTTGLLVLHRFGHALSQVDRRRTFSLFAFNDSFLSRRVWALGITLPYALWGMFCLYNGQRDQGVADLYAAVIATMYHLDTYKDRRVRQ